MKKQIKKEIEDYVNLNREDALEEVIISYFREINKIFIESKIIRLFVK